MIYFDSEDKLQEDVVSFWNAVERARNKQPVYHCNPGCTPWFSMEENDLFLLGLPEHQMDNWQSLDHQYLNSHLYRIQKVSSGYYVFRLHRASTINYDSEMISIRSMGALKETNPIKIKMNEIGNLKPW